MFIFDYKLGTPTQRYNPIIELSNQKFAKEGTIKLFPRAKNSILVRIENISDRFDGA